MGPLGESAAPFQFTGRQQSVHIAIAGKSIALAELYESALRTLHDVGNPGRLFLAGHCIREMTNGLPKVLDVPILTGQARMGDQVSALEPVWDRALKGECFKDGRWSGTIDGPLERLLRRLHEFFRWLSENRPKRRHVAVNLFRNLDPAGIPLPKALEKQRVDLWLELHDYFVNTAHRAATTDADFHARLEALDQLLLDGLYRQPSEDLSAIDAILREARDA